MLKPNMCSRVCVCFQLQQQRMWMFAQMHNMIIKRCIKSYRWQTVHCKNEHILLRLLFTQRLSVFEFSPASASHSSPSVFPSFLVFFFKLLLSLVAFVLYILHSKDIYHDGASDYAIFGVGGLEWIKFKRPPCVHLYKGRDVHVCFCVRCLR